MTLMRFAATAILPAPLILASFTPPAAAQMVGIGMVRTGQRQRGTCLQLTAQSAGPQPRLGAENM